MEKFSISRYAIGLAERIIAGERATRPIDHAVLVVEWGIAIRNAEAERASRGSFEETTDQIVHQCLCVFPTPAQASESRPRARVGWLLRLAAHDRVDMTVGPDLQDLVACETTRGTRGDSTKRVVSRVARMRHGYCRQGCDRGVELVPRERRPHQSCDVEVDIAVEHDDVTLWFDGLRHASGASVRSMRYLLDAIRLVGLTVVKVRATPLVLSWIAILISE